MTPTYEALLAAARAEIPEIPAPELQAALAGGSPPVVLDVREQDEVEAGAIAGAVCIPRGVLEMRLPARVPDRGTRIVAYCAGGTRSALAGLALRQLGYGDVLSLAGGFAAWKAAGLPFTVPPASPGVAGGSRYSRHLRIPEVGEAGQARLRAARILLVGAGGLGSPAGLYLAAAGVGTLDIVDADRVDLSNLQRQVLHRTRDVGLPKVRSARENLFDLNPEVRVNALEVRLGADNVDALVAGHDVVVDGSDNFETRYRVSDACVALGIPNVYASVHRFDGQATVFWPGRGPCYRCLFPEPPPAHLAPSCEEAGVLGVLPGLMGIIQATEALKIVLGIGEPLVGRLLVHDALDAVPRIWRIERRPDCPACGDHPDPSRRAATFTPGPSCER